MLNDNLRELEQIIDQLPDRAFSYRYSTGVEISLWHDSLWQGRLIDTNNSNRHIMPPCDAQTFQEVSDSLILYGLTDQTIQELLDAARKQLASKA